MTRHHHMWILAALAAPAGLAGLATPALAQPVQTSPPIGSGFGNSNYNNSGISTPGIGSNVSTGNAATSTLARPDDGTSPPGRVVYGPNVLVVPARNVRQGPTIIRNQSAGAVGAPPIGALNGGVPTGALDGGVPGATGGANTNVPGGNTPARGPAR